MICNCILLNFNHVVLPAVVHPPTIYVLCANNYDDCVQD